MMTLIERYTRKNNELTDQVCVLSVHLMGLRETEKALLRYSSLGHYKVHSRALQETKDAIAIAELRIRIYNKARRHVMQGMADLGSNMAGFTARTKKDK